MEPEISLLHSPVPRHLSLSWARSIQSMPPHPTSWRSILILSSHLRLGLPSGSFLQVSPPKSCIRLSPLPIRATCPAHLILLDLITRTIFGEGYKSLSSSFCSFLHSPVTSFILDPNILLSTLSSNNLGVRSSLNVSDQVSYPYKTSGEIKVLYILMFKFFINGNVISREMFTKVNSSRSRQHTLNRSFFLFYRV